MAEARFRVQEKTVEKGIGPISNQAGSFLVYDNLTPCVPVLGRLKEAMPQIIGFPARFKKRPFLQVGQFVPPATASLGLLNSQIAISLIKISFSVLG